MRHCDSVKNEPTAVTAVGSFGYIADQMRATPVSLAVLMTASATACTHSGEEIRGYITAASKTALSHDVIMRIADVLNRNG